MEQTLRRFTTDKLFDATSALLGKLNIEFDRETAMPIDVAEFYDGPMPQYLTAALQHIADTYFIGIVNDGSLHGEKAAESLSSVADTVQHGGKYDGMFVFACDAKPDANLTRTAASALTRAFNRIASANPVILFIRQGNLLSLATCERMEYSQVWRQGGGEKLGKVSILRNINCEHTHAGHLQILEQLASNSFDTFEKLYKHWMQVFNSELLTKKFYNDLFEWYQWAVNPETKVTFPGNADTQNDDREDIDTRVIRLITRLMFVWFIKQKGLVPDCIFNEEYLKTILNDFDPQSARDTNYYQAILQNLFFGTLNRAIIEDGEKREFAKASRSDVKNLYRYEELFSISEQEVIDMFSTVPFLNCGLFECQDKTKMLDGVARRYYNDGFSRNAAKFADGTYRYRAVVPNVLFFHPDKGILSIFNRYVFTIEENTPQDVQVALDPELLGKVFENLLGAYNPETKETARNQSGSFYTPREIVQYMVNESLVAHLKRTVGEHLEQQYRQLLDFTTEDVELTDKEKKDILHSLFTCKVLDPACGSGAFPMGMLQQMVHILRQVDPDNSQWRDVLLNMAVDESRRAFGIIDDVERKKKLQEIEETFNNGLNSPDYTRKLYIIESCIYGVDIQPIAMLITRLRFFITLICEQNDIKRDKPEENFGIKTLPNLESKFVAANSLIDADIHKYNEDWTQNEMLGILKDELMAIRRRHFYTRKRSEKMRLLREDEKKREQIHEYINKLVGEPNHKQIAELERVIKEQEALLPKYQGEKWEEETIQKDLFADPEVIRVDRNKAIRNQILTYISNAKRDIEHEKNKTIPQGFNAAVLQVTEWNPYDQNTVSPFLDMEWMFGVADGFDIVIANPPYISTKDVKNEDKVLYEEHFGFSDDTYNLFTFRGFELLKERGSLTYITPKTFWTTQTKRNMRDLVLSKNIEFIFDTANPFEAAMVDTGIIQVLNTPMEENHKVRFYDGRKDLRNPIKFEDVLQSTYVNTLHSVIFKPSSHNLRIWNKYNNIVNNLYESWWSRIDTSRNIDKSKDILIQYRESLRESDVALLGCLTEGGQGMATANNGRFIAVRKSTKWAANVVKSRPQKIKEAIKKERKFQKELLGLTPEEFIKSKSETEIVAFFDEMKEKYDRDIFGQGYIYRIIDDKDLVKVETLTEEEKQFGIEPSKKHFVLYDKGDKDGNRWYLETPFAIDWSKENVLFLKTNSGKKGKGMPVVRNPQFYFREGLCWSDINTTYLKCRQKSKSIHDVKSMSMFGMTDKVPEYYIICLINSSFMSLYVDDFVNNTQTFQINDARQLPIVVPTKKQLNDAKRIFDEAVNIQKEVFAGTKTRKEADRELQRIQTNLDTFVESIYLS